MLHGRRPTAEFQYRAGVRRLSFSTGRASAGRVSPQGGQPNGRRRCSIKTHLNPVFLLVSCLYQSNLSISCMCCSNGDAQARGIVWRQRRRPLCKTTSHNAAHSRARTSECASKLPKSAKAGAIHQMQAEQHRSTTAHMWQPSGGRLQHRRLPQGGLPVTQQPFLQPTAEAFKLLQGSIHRCAVPTLRPSPLPAPAATSRKRPPHPPRRLPHSKSSHKPPHAARTRRNRQTL